jgi:hypothetical protein
MPLSEFAPPWFEGHAATIENVPSTWPVAIGGHGYMVEPELYERTFVPVQRDPSDDSTEPGEQSLSPAGLWRRSQSDWSLGAGQLWLDQDESTRHRFNESLGVDVFNDSYVTLLPITEEKRDTAQSNLRLLVAGSRLYVADGQTVRFSDGTDSEQNATWVTGWTTATGLPAANVLDMASSGTNVYVLMGDNSIYRATLGTTAFTLYYNPPSTVPTRMWIALGRLFMSDGRTLYEVNATPGETSVFVHPDPGMVWSALVGSPSGIFVAGNIGQNGEVRRLVVNTSGSGFDVPVVAAEFRNEQINALEAVGQNLFIGTSGGFRYAPITDAGLDYGPLVQTGAVHAFATDTIDNETFIWFTWSNIVAGSSGLGRIRPARFTAPRVPAYASDIYTTAGGTSLAAASLHDRRYFAISGAGFYGATENFVASGTLSTGRIRYGMLDAKVFSDLAWRTAPLPSDASVSARVVSDSGEVANLSPQVATASTASALNRLGPMRGEWVEVTFTLTRGGEVTRALLLPGTAGDNASTPDAAGFAVTDINLTWHGAMDNWVPGGFGKFLIAQWPNTPGNNGWALAVAPGGELQISWSNDGTAVNNETSPLPLGFLAGSEHWLRASLDVDNGAGGKRLVFQTSEDGTTWTTLDDRTEAGTTAIFNSTATVVISDVLPFEGYCRFAEVRNGATPGAGTVIANPAFDDQEEGITSFADTAAVPKTWTVNSDANIGLVPGSDAEAPELRAWVLRSIPVPETTQVFRVPVKLQHKVYPPHGPIRGVHSDVELEYLSSLVANQAIVTYQEGHAQYSVHVANMLAKGVDWDKTANHFETLCLVELHEI